MYISKIHAIYCTIIQGLVRIVEFSSVYAVRLHAWEFVGEIQRTDVVGLLGRLSTSDVVLGNFDGQFLVAWLKTTSALSA